MVPNTLERRGKYLVGALMVIILVLTLTLLQQRFDQGDYERAVRMLSTKQAGETWSISEELVQRAGSAAVDCQPKLLSSFKGTLEVTCRTGKEEPTRFEVDLVRKHVEPLDARAKELIGAVAARNAHPPTDAGGR